MNVIFCLHHLDCFFFELAIGIWYILKDRMILPILKNKLAFNIIIYQLHLKPNLRYKNEVSTFYNLLLENHEVSETQTRYTKYSAYPLMWPSYQDS